jgi:hypothetical protein
VIPVQLGEAQIGPAIAENSPSPQATVSIADAPDAEALRPSSASDTIADADGPIQTPTPEDFLQGIDLVSGPQQADQGATVFSRVEINNGEFVPDPNSDLGSGDDRQTTDRFIVPVANQDSQLIDNSKSYLTGSDGTDPNDPTDLDATICDQDGTFAGSNSDAVLVLNNGANTNSEWMQTFAATNQTPGAFGDIATTNTSLVVAGPAPNGIIELSNLRLSAAPLLLAPTVGPARGSTSAPSAAPVASTPSPTGNLMLGGDTDLIAGGSGGGTTSGGGSDTIPSGPSGSSGFVINVTYDASCNSAPPAFKTDIGEVVQYYESLFSAVPITINIDVGYGEIDGGSLGSSDLGASLYYENVYSYSQVLNALQATDANPAAVSTLPSSDPTNGGYLLLTTSQAKAVGLMSGSSLDGYAGFDSTANIFTYNNSNGVAPGQYDFFGTVAHEFAEVMGRMIPGSSSYYSILDLFDYSAPGARDLVGAPPGYFSINGGTTNLDNFNTNPNGDYGDWAGSAGNDSYLAYDNAGVVTPVTATDVAVMSAIGWSLGIPAAPIITNDTVNNTNSVTLSGTAVPTGTVTVYDGKTVLGTITATDSGSWSFTSLSLSGGTHSITATATDPGGTSATSNVVNPTVSTGGPTIASLVESP